MSIESEVQLECMVAAVDGLRSRERAQTHRLQAIEQRLAALEVRMVHVEAIEAQIENGYLNRIFGRSTLSKQK